MLTNEKILEVFGEFLKTDPETEVVLTSKGYIILNWCKVSNDFVSYNYCKDSEALLKGISDCFLNYHEQLATRGKRDLLEEESVEFEKMKDLLVSKCYEGE